LFDTAERSKAAVESLALELRAMYAQEYQRLVDVGEEPQLMQLTAAYESGLDELDELHSAFESIPSRYSELSAELSEDHVAVKLTIQIAQHNLRLSQFYDGLRQLS
jgi:hypothetical protein